MRGSLWTISVAAIGSALLLRGADEAVPANAASSTESVVSVLETVAPFAGQLLFVAALGYLIIVALRVA